jgi:hypothetical protein
MSRRGDVALTLALTAVMAGLMALTFGLGRSARLVPQVAIAVTLALLAAESVRQLGRATRSRGEGPPRSGFDGRELRAFAWIGAGCGLIALLGAASGTAIVLAGYLRLEARTTWWTSLVCGLGLALLVAHGMQRALGMSLPPPLLAL